ncbi:MAG: hypothetical protein IPG50_26030 [Myxococcales bacterium]|nr:hypothetical protein [Myxococcales bacterium]
MRLWVLALLVTSGCAAQEPVARGSAQSPTAAPPVATEVSSAAAPRFLRRDDVRRTVRDGLGAFLQRVELTEQPAFERGRFKGFRVARLVGDPSFWAGVDLQPGDVLLSINGTSIERPEHALAVFHGLETAPELRVIVERNGQPRELRYPIEDRAKK